MARNRLVALILTALIMFSIQGMLASAQDRTNPPAAIERLFEASEIEAGWFAPSFLAQVPADQVADIIASMENQHGTFQSVSGGGQRFTVTLERAEVPTRLVLDAEGRIAGLLFEPPIAFGDLSGQVETIAALPGRTSVLVLSNGEVQAEHNADEPLAVGSAAKLAILKAVNDAVEDGRLNWDQVVRIEEAWRSLPTGVLQDWPVGTPLTIATLANLMISISDNTATDALIRIVGREAVEAATPRNTPFPTTREIFTLKTSGNAELRQAWADGDAAGRRDILERIASLSLPAAEDFVSDPTVDVEWFLTARELCTVMDEVAALPALQINPGVADPGNWDEIAFKGGSEAGVLNFTTRVESADGTSHCVVATWNNPDAVLDNQQLTSSYRAMLSALAKGE